MDKIYRVIEGEDLSATDVFEWLAEGGFKSLVESIFDESFIRINEDGVLVLWNPSTDRMLKRNIKDELSEYYFESEAMKILMIETFTECLNIINNRPIQAG